MTSKKLRTIIIDDEPNAVKVVKLLLHQFFPNEVELTGTTNDPEEAIVLINTCEPDLVFLDIQMHGKSGFDVLHAVGHRSFQVVFITAHDEYAIRAFRENAVDYILKPVDPNFFKLAVEKVRQRHEEPQRENIGQLLERIKEPAEHIGLPTKDGFVLVTPAQILFARAEGSYTRVVTDDDREFLLSKNLKMVEAQLLSAYFLRINRSAMINLKHLTGFSRSEGGFVTLTGNHSFSIGSTNRQEILKQIEQHITLL